ncbi:MAG TPA: YceI family protein [Casimicrobiaceae bacterium]|nr:YceI family protein [Casimicrobiaceae bacterium]
MMLMRALMLPLLLLAYASQAGAAGVLIDKSDIRFVSKQMGVNFEGRFRKWNANVVFLPDNLARSKAEFDIDLASIDLESDDSESEIKGALWFDTAKFPVAHFSSTSMKSLGGDKFEITGLLTIKGVAKNAIVPISLKRDAAGNAVADGTFSVKRLDYGIGLGLWADTETVANDVMVRVHMVLAPPK